MPTTHRHLLKANEIIPGIAGDELGARRERLMGLLSKDSIAVIPSSRIQYSSQNILYTPRLNA